MVVESYLAVTKEKNLAEPPPPQLPLLQELMGEIHHPPLDAGVSPPPKIHWPVIAIRNHLDNDNNNLPIIFPPINHENLYISTEKILHVHSDNQQHSFSDSDSDLDSDSISSSTFSPSESSPSPPSPIVSVSDLTGIPASDAAGWFDSWMNILCAKRLRNYQESKGRLIGIIKEKDKKSISTVGSNITNESSFTRISKSFN
ncbi:hypothetical protein CASFOL_018437 [Castilleja foliolosa]|uniref:Uncharacterized protein n=1 Tax=Castilleja foliolosa TaxID=1961234 RepID=A0ABD3DA11_9LAMI